jgi:hypothetical protein
MEPFIAVKDSEVILARIPEWTHVVNFPFMFQTPRHDGKRHTFSFPFRGKEKKNSRETAYLIKIPLTPDLCVAKRSVFAWRTEKKKSEDTEAHTVNAQFLGDDIEQTSCFYVVDDRSLEVVQVFGCRIATPRLCQRRDAARASESGG